MCDRMGGACSRRSGVWMPRNTKFLGHISVELQYLSRWSDSLSQFEKPRGQKMAWLEYTQNLVVLELARRHTRRRRHLPNAVARVLAAVVHGAPRHPRARTPALEIPLPA